MLVQLWRTMVVDTLPHGVVLRESEVDICRTWNCYVVILEL